MLGELAESGLDGQGFRMQALDDGAIVVDVSQLLGVLADVVGDHAIQDLGGTHHLHDVHGAQVGALLCVALAIEDLLEERADIGPQALRRRSSAGQERRTLLSEKLKDRFENYKL